MKKVTLEAVQQIPFPTQLLLGKQQEIAASIHGRVAAVESLSAAVERLSEAINAMPDALLRDRFVGSESPPSTE